MRGWGGRNAVTSGWAGRFLDRLPNAAHESLYGVSLHGAVSEHLQGDVAHASSLPLNIGGAFGIDRTCDGVDLRSGTLRLDLADVVPPIGASSRIGIRAASTWPLRFVDLSSKSISPFRANATVWEDKSR